MIEETSPGGSADSLPNVGDVATGPGSLPAIRGRLAIGLLLLGVALAGVCGTMAGLAAGNSFKAYAQSAVPGTFATHLARGEWEIYQQTGTVGGSWGDSFSYSQGSEGPATIDSTDIQVMDPNGRPVATRNVLSPIGPPTYFSGSQIYTGVASFELTVGGNYQIIVAAPQAGQVMVARPVVAGILRILRWIAGGAIGVIVFVIGLILLIVDIDRRRRARSPSPAVYVDPVQWGSFEQQPPVPVRRAVSGSYGAAPFAGFGEPAGGVAPGWHPDPSGRHRFRYWNGAAWTEHVSSGDMTSTDPFGV